MEHITERMSPVKLSVIMPCYNVEETLSRALQSVVSQKVDFPYEILIVDDASTDETFKLAQNWQERYPQIKVICNEKNRGNAYSYYAALCASQGKYFCVLDGDDYYTVSDKLQRQVDFLDLDKAEEYVGVATWYIIDLEHENVYIPPRTEIKEFGYVDFLTEKVVYLHTATYMYRNIFRGNVPVEMSNALYRGDTPRTMFHLKYSGKKIRVLDFVGSAYVFHGNGLWSGMKQTQQLKYEVSFWTKHKAYVTTSFERDVLDRRIQRNATEIEKAPKDDLQLYPEIMIDEAIELIQRYAEQFQFTQSDFVLENAYYSQYIDSLLESLGYIQRIYHPEFCQKTANSEKLCIINGILNPTGGSIFAELEQLIESFPDKEVYLFVTNMSKIPHDTIELLEKHTNLTLVCAPENESSRLGWYRRRFVEISPACCYCYCSHHDVIGPALIESGVCENLAFFSFDHGYLCGISNSMLDGLIAKREVDWLFLSKSFPGKKISWIPAWSRGAINCENLCYAPFAAHEQLITASGAARFYKVDGRSPYRYIDVILRLLQQTRGTHYHFGPLPDQIIQEVEFKLKELDLPMDCFVHIPWVENIPQTLLKNHVDIFIEPFPVVSYKLSLDVLSAGVPIIARKSLRRMETTDFIPPNSLYWSTVEEFLSLLSGLTSKKLEQLSWAAKQYFEENFTERVVTGFLRGPTRTAFNENRVWEFVDNRILDILDSSSLFGDGFGIIIQRQDESQDRNEGQKGGFEELLQNIRFFFRKHMGNTFPYKILRKCWKLVKR